MRRRSVVALEQKSLKILRGAYSTRCAPGVPEFFHRLSKNGVSRTCVAFDGTAVCGRFKQDFESMIVFRWSRAWNGMGGGGTLPRRLQQASASRSGVRGKIKTR